MPVELALVTAPPRLYRVERSSPPLRFSVINPVDALQPRTGNRFDIPGAGVLYGATKHEGGFAETLASFRPVAAVAASMGESEPGRVLPGEVPASWFPSRRLRSFTVDDALPFLDVEDPRTHTFLTMNAVSVMAQHDAGSLDVAAVRGPNRLLTRAIASWAYYQSDPHGQPLFAGIRYISRLGDYECWAVFDGTHVQLRDTWLVAPTDPPVRTVLNLFGMRVRI